MLIDLNKLHGQRQHFERGGDAMQAAQGVLGEMAPHARRRDHHGEHQAEADGRGQP